ncbi:hypothetical protein NXS19_004014 [Fusarium pseudograminearum]|nr:hypothetical protein NXS19_004014 [Fusarium pseudograminearum]
MRDVWTHTIPMSSINLDHCRLLSDLADLDLRLASHSNLLKGLLGVGNAMSGLATEVVRDEMIREELLTEETVLRLHRVISHLKHNNQVEMFCQHLTRTFEDWGFSADGEMPVPNIMRPYPLAGELRSTENSFKPGQKETEVDNLTVGSNRVPGP